MLPGHPPLVLLAGMNCTQDLWADAALDADGDTIRPVLDLASVSAQVEELSSALPETFVLVGHSLGAIVGMELALAVPDRVAGLCLVSTNAKAPTDTQREGWRSWLSALDHGVSPRSLQESILEPLLGEQVSRSRPDLAQRALRMGDETGAVVLRAQLQTQLTRTDLLARLPELRMPALVVSGLDDAICPPHFHTEIVSALRDARLVSLDAGHLLPMERPREFGDLVRSWLGQHRFAAPTASVRPKSVARWRGGAVARWGAGVRPGMDILGCIPEVRAPGCAPRDEGELPGCRGGCRKVACDSGAFLHLGEGAGAGCWGGMLGRDAGA